MLSCICLLKYLSIYLLICHIWNQRKKTELSELNELECSKSPSHMSSYAYKLGFLYLHAQPNLDTLVYWSYTKSLKMKKKFNKNFSLKNLKEFITHEIFVIEHSAWCQMKENYQIYLLYQFHWNPQSVDWQPQLMQKKKKHVSFKYVKKMKNDFASFSTVKKSF